MSTESELAHVRDVMRTRPFWRLWLVMGVSSIGDWMGLLATSAFAASHVEGSAAKGVAFGGVVAIRLLPALVLGPLAGVVADRFDRRHTMAVCDLLRFVLFGSIPVVGWLVESAALVVGWAALAMFVIEAIGMVWGPAKDAAVPNLVPPDRLETANQLNLATMYGIAPVAGAGLLAALEAVVPVLAAPPWLSAADVALWFNALTFLANAVVIGYGIREISGRGGQAITGAGDLRRTLAEGWSYVRGTPLVRGLATGILVAYAGAGAVVGTALFYAESIGGGPSTFSLLFAALFAGLGLGIVGGPSLVHELSRRRWFGLSIALGGCAVVVVALAPNLAVAIPACIGVGAGAGMAQLAGMTLLGGETADELRGRVFAFIEAGCRFVLLLSIFVTSALVGIAGTEPLRLAGLTIPSPATRLILLLAGIGTAVAATLVLRRIDDREGTRITTDIRAAFRRPR